MNTGDNKRAVRPSLWPQWTLLVIFTFIAFESALLAAALKGRWFILLAPAAVCALKAIDTWRVLRRRLFSDISDRIDSKADRT